MSHNNSRSGRVAYDNEQTKFIHNYLQTAGNGPPPPQPRVWKQGEAPKTVKDLWKIVSALSDEVFAFREENHHLRQAINNLTMRNARLESDLEALDQYSRRENVCFISPHRKCSRIVSRLRLLLLPRRKLFLLMRRRVLQFSPT